MPGLTYNSSGVKDLINAVQGYPVRDENQPGNNCFLNATAFREKAPVLQPSHTFLQGEMGLLKLSFGVYCQASTVFSQRLSNSFVLSTHLVLSHIRGCLLRLALEGIIFKQSVEREFFIYSELE